MSDPDREIMALLTHATRRLFECAQARRSLVLHTADELIHHGAQPAIVRDVYAARADIGSQVNVDRRRGY